MDDLSFLYENGMPPECQGKISSQSPPIADGKDTAKIIKPGNPKLGFPAFLNGSCFSNSFIVKQLHPHLHIPAEFCILKSCRAELHCKFEGCFFREAPVKTRKKAVL